MHYRISLLLLLFSALPVATHAAGCDRSNSAPPVQSSCCNRQTSTTRASSVDPLPRSNGTGQLDNLSYGDAQALRTLLHPEGKEGLQEVQEFLSQWKEMLADSKVTFTKDDGTTVTPTLNEFIMNQHNDLTLYTVDEDGTKAFGFTLAPLGTPGGDLASSGDERNVITEKSVCTIIERWYVDGASPSAPPPATFTLGHLGHIYTIIDEKQENVLVNALEAWKKNKKDLFEALFLPAQEDTQKGQEVRYTLRQRIRGLYIHEGASTRMRLQLIEKECQEEIEEAWKTLSPWSWARLRAHYNLHKPLRKLHRRQDLIGIWRRVMQEAEEVQLGYDSACKEQRLLSEAHLLTQASLGEEVTAEEVDKHMIKHLRYPPAVAYYEMARQPITSRGYRYDKTLGGSLLPCVALLGYGGYYLYLRYAAGNTPLPSSDTLEEEYSDDDDEDTL